MPLSLLQKPVGTLDLLLYLHRNGPSSVSRLLEGVRMARGTFYSAKAKLGALRLAYERPDPAFPSRNLLALTAEGEAIARALVEADELVGRTGEAVEAEFARLEVEAVPESVGRRLDLLEAVLDGLMIHGEWDRAPLLATRMVELAETAGDRRRTALGHLVRGEILQKRDRHEEALSALEAARGAGADPEIEDLAAEAEYLIGSDHERRGRWEDALTVFRTASERAQRSGSTALRARSEEAVARVHARRGDLEESATILERVVRTLEEAGEHRELARACASLGATAYRLNRADALDWFDRAIEAARRAADPRLEAYGLLNASAPLIDAGELRGAERRLNRARVLFSDLEEGAGLAATELNFGNLYAAQSRWSEAERSFDEAERLARESGNRYQEASALFNHGQMMKRRSLAVEARGFLSAARGIFTELGSADRVARCDDELRDLTT